MPRAALVLNEETLEPVAQAMLTIGNQVATTDEQGRFEHPAAKGSCSSVTGGVRGPGFNRAQVSYGPDDSTFLRKPVSLDEQIQAEIEEAIELAKNSPDPEPGDALMDVHCES